MNPMGHDIPNMIGVDQAGVEEKVRNHAPDYMAMGQNGMDDMGGMNMEGPENTLPMMAGDGPFGPINMGGMFTLLKVTEATTLDKITDLRFMPYVPFFPLAMVGGLVVQLALRRAGKQELLSRRISEVIGSIALDVLIASAIATVSLTAIAANWEVFVVMGLAGIGWILFSFFVLAPRMFPSFWFEKGLTNVGQSMGTTATGFMFQRLADPANTSGAKESFSYKQLVFEPFMGGGIITATSLVVIHELGSGFAFISALVVFVFWLVLGLRLGKRGRK
jgi:ESS family glutamate:Na+ symporter